MKDEQNKYEPHQLIVEIDQLSLDREIGIKSVNQNSVFKFFISTTLENNIKKLKLYGDSDKMRIDAKQEEIKLQVILNIKKLGISLISSPNPQKEHQNRFELAYICLKNLEYALLATPFQRTMQVRVGQFSVDNQSEYQTPCPKTISCHENKEGKPFFNFVLEENLVIKNFKVIDSMRLSVQPIEIFASDTLVEKYIAFIQLLKSLKPNVQRFQITEKMFWEKSEIKKENLSLYIRKIEFYPLKINLSFKIEPPQMGDQG